MKKVILTILTAFSILIGATSYASENSVFDRVTKLCHASLSEELNLVWQGGKDVFSDLRLLAPSRDLTELYHHPDFERALTSCYDKNETKKTAFKVALRMSDISGKALGVVSLWAHIFKIPAAIYAGTLGLFGSKALATTAEWTYLLAPEVSNAARMYKRGVDIEPIIKNEQLDAQTRERLKKLIADFDAGKLTQLQLHDAITRTMITEPLEKTVEQTREQYEQVVLNDSHESRYTASEQSASLGR
ncbi:MAG: hypothetical protein AB7F43_01230 [Bacteriovoracia bacterium]